MRTKMKTIETQCSCGFQQIADKCGHGADKIWDRDRVRTDTDKHYSLSCLSGLSANVWREK